MSGSPTIRPLERSDLPAAAALFAHVMGLPPARAPDLEAFFGRTLFDCPWADPETPSLVALDGDTVVGMIASEVRRMRLGDRPVRVVAAGHLVVHPDARSAGTGALLMHHQMRGPQDLTVDDNASDFVERIWVRLGGERDELKAIHWVRVLRPWSVAAGVAAERIARPRSEALLGAAAARLDALTSAVGAPLLAVGASDATAVDLTPALLLEHLPGIAGRSVLRPDWDAPFLEWLFDELGRVERRGRLVAQLVLAAGGRPLGWYVYYLRPGWRSEVLQIAAGARDRGAVLDHLLAHAAAHGSAAVRGRLEPGMLPALVGRRCLLWRRGGALVHTRDPELRAALHADGALLSRLDGDWYSNALV